LAIAPTITMMTASAEGRVSRPAINPRPAKNSKKHTA